MRRLLEHVIALPDELLPSLTIQDAALCHLWRVNGGSELDVIDGADRLERLINQWLGAASPGRVWSEGRRTQTLLRELIERAQSDAVDEMARDELDLLEAVYAFSQAAQHAESFEQVLRLIAPRRTRIATRRAKLSPVAGLPALSRRYLVVTPEDILRAPHREVRVLAGVELPARGPVLAHSGHVRVLGDVPDGTTLVVEQADCVVDGCVMGRIAVSGSCEITENVSGVVISRNGDIRARNAVDNSIVVAKRGRVYFRRVSGARMVFAGDILHVSEVATRSHLLAPKVIVDEALSSGRVHASVSINSTRFGGEGMVDLVLRPGLSCRDYGEDPGSAMTVDVARALRARGTLQCTRSQMSLALRAAEQSAETCLMFLLAADQTSRIAEEIIASQRRLEVLHRIMLGLRALYAEAEAEDNNNDPGDPDAATNASAVVDQFHSEISAVIDETADDDLVRTMYNDLSATREKVAQPRVKNALLRATLDEIVAKLERGRSETERLRETIRRGLDKLARTSGVREVLGGASAAKSKVLTLHRVLERARTASRETPLRTRADSGFIATMSRTIEKRISEAKRLKFETDSLRREFEEARRHVWNLYQMRIDDDDGIDRAITVEGAFEGDVRMFVDPRFMVRTESVSDETAFIPSPSRDGRVRFVCAGGQIREVAITSDSADSGAELSMA